MLVVGAGSVLKSVQDLTHDSLDSNSIFHLGKNERAITAHFSAIPLHDGQVCSDGFRQIRFIDHQQVALRDSRTAFAGDLVSSRNVDHLETGREIVSAGFNQEKLRLEEAMQILQREQIRRNILADGRVRATSGLDSPDAFTGKRLVLGEKIPIFSSKYVIGDDSDTHDRVQLSAKLQHQSGLAASHGASDADGESATTEIPIDGQIALVKRTGVIEVFVSVPDTTSLVVMLMMMDAHEESIRCLSHASPEV
jgi:hypothetical protein